MKKARRNHVRSTAARIVGERRRRVGSLNSGGGPRLGGRVGRHKKGGHPGFTHGEGALSPTPLPLRRWANQHDGAKPPRPRRPHAVGQEAPPAREPGLPRRGAGRANHPGVGGVGGERRRQLK